MDFKDLFAMLALVVVAISGLMGLATTFNSEYGLSIGGDFENTATATQNSIVGNLSSYSSEVGQSGFDNEGQSPGTAEDSLTRRALRIFTNIPDLVYLPYTLILDFAPIIGVPPVVMNVAVYTFIFGFMLTLGYMLILGVRSLRN